MKKVMDWAKAHLLIVVFVAMIVVLIPAGVVGSMMWNGSIHKKAQGAYDETKRKLDSQTKVSYALPAVFEGESAESVSRPPNRAVTRFYAEQKARRTEQVKRVVDEAVETNRDDHTVLIDGLFPTASNELTRLSLSRDLLRRLRGGPRTTSAYAGLLSSVNAGTPLDSASIDAQVNDFATQEREKLELSATDGKLSDAQQQELTERVRERRLALVASRAREISVYADLSAVLPTEGRSPGVASLPLDNPAQISATDAFAWQWDYWVAQKILEVVREANTDARGIPTRSVAESPVKRVDALTIQAAQFGAAGGGGGDSYDDFGGGRGGGRAQAPGSGGGATGDWPAIYQAKKATDLYDVRLVRLELTVATAKLPFVLDAFERAGLMRVVDMDVSALDAQAELDAGYYFGTDHVSRATLVVETVWLREWTKAFMPPAVRTALGIPLDQPAADTDSGEAP